MARFNVFFIAVLPLIVFISGCSPDKSDEDTSAQLKPKDERPASRVVPQVQDVFNVGDSIYVRSLATEANTLWVGTSLGVMEIDIETRGVRNTFNRDHGLANEYVFAIGIDPDGYKWFGTNAGGMTRYKEGDWKTFFPMHGLADYWVYSFANHPDGSLWVGTWAGVNRVNRATNRFETYVTELVNEWVYGLDVDDKGRVWFGTEGGVSRFDGTEWVSWTHKDGLGAPNANALPFSTNTGLGTRSRHDLGILTGGQATYNPNYVFSLIVDQDQKVWAGTWGGGVSYFDHEQWKNYTTKDGLAGDIVYSMIQTRDGVYWFGTNRGLSRFDGKIWLVYNQSNGLPGNNVYAIAEDGNGDVWVGTRGGVARVGLAPE